MHRRAFLAGAAVAPLASCAGFPRGLGRDLAWIDATETASLIRKGEISAAEAMDAAIERAEALNPKLNFLVTPDFDRARTRARESFSGPFAGAPILIKDLNDVAGLPTRWGSRSLLNAPPAQATEATAGAVLAAGFNPFGKSATPEYGFLPTTEPVAFGPTRNPWSLIHSAGGSSGGAAAATAAGVIPVGHASDGGGSIRIPASCCGLFGLKPSRARVIGDKDGPAELSVELGVTRTVRDAAALLAAMEQTGAGARHPPVGMVTDPIRRKLRVVFLTKDPLGYAPGGVIQQGVEETAKLLADLGHEVEQATDWPMDASRFSDDFLALWGSYAARVVAAVSQHAPPDRLGELLEPFTLGLARSRASLGPGEFDMAMARMGAAVRGYLGWFQRYDVVLTSVLGHPPTLLGWMGPTVPYDELVERLRKYVGYTPLNNMAGNPAMSVPLWSNVENLPVGMHFAAAPGQERTLLELAYQLEQARPWANQRPPVRA